MIKKLTSPNIQVISSSFGKDPHFLSVYTHIDPTLENCSKAAYDVYNQYNCLYYQVSNDNELVGFFGIEPIFQFINGFYIDPDFRNKDNIQSFAQLIKDTLKEYPISTWFTSVDVRNKKALNFWKKEGANEINTITMDNNLKRIILTLEIE